ncbi:hypothetical protein MFIFM68171_08023 [Madurella fahalii]|uniref:CARDB domain-containing protein n=1 Tax=Madurella fahalii TaxID=1157608 RepID=A0ABQ0GJ64_9PEZI
MALKWICGFPLHSPFHRYRCYGCSLAKDAETVPRLKLDGISPPLPEHVLDETKQEQFLSLYPAKGCRPIIADFAPHFAYPGSLIVIVGHNFYPRRDKNEVTIGGRSAIVVTAEPHRLVVISDFFAEIGPVQVCTRKGIGKSKHDFTPISGPPPGPQFLDAPPLSYEGIGNDPVTPDASVQSKSPVSDQAVGPIRTLADQLPNTGVSKILCVCLHPWDVVPSDKAAARQVIVNITEDVKLYYSQASYGALTLDFTVTDYYEMTDGRDYYHDTGINNFRGGDVLQQVWTEAAHQASTNGHDLGTFDVLMVACYVERTARARGNITIEKGRRDLFRPKDPPRQLEDIRYTVDIPKQLFAMIVAETANWGRVAHEYGHNLIENESVLPEDIYSSDLPPGSDFTGEYFDLMGKHDSHPLFSAYFMDQLGWYESTNPDVHNVRRLSWSQEEFSEDFDLVAHGEAQNSDLARAHLVKIAIGTGLEYWIEVRQKPGPVAPGGTAQVFDPSIPTQATADGGVLVTRVIRDTQNNNQEMRLITLLQSQAALLLAGDIATDSARTIKISVVSSTVQARPLVCRVRVEWSQPLSPDPSGLVDLWITPWSTSTYTTPDIWVVPPGGDAAEPPVVGERNTIHARVRNAGSVAAADVRATVYAVEPPGVGDNGSWTPLGVRTLPAIPAGGHADVQADWVPRVGQHTCLQVVISPQAGEVTFGNNRAQENVFRFQPASGSAPYAVEVPVAVRNPLAVETQVVVQLAGVPAGFYVYFPHRVVTVAAKGERRLELIVVPLREIHELESKVAAVRVTGLIAREYEEDYPSVYRRIGGLQAVVQPKRASRIRLFEPPREDSNTGRISVSGEVVPAVAKQRVRVDLRVREELYRIQAVETGRAGRFSATFALRSRDDVPRISEKTIAQLSVVAVDATIKLGFQAHIVDATELAPADSNVVYYEYTVKAPDPEVPK